MAFAKIQKTSSYYSGFQVKFRRRREGKTDYRARRNLVRQALNKYNTPKYRFVVRSTNKRLICQVVYSTMCGDRIVCAADSSELARYGLPVGGTNYAAAYATGLLCARRTLTNLNLHTVLLGKAECDGEEYHIEEEMQSEDLSDKANGTKMMQCNLDIGLVRTTTGNRVFGALKGAVDGGLAIPHSIKRFPGYKTGESDDSYNAELHRDRIFGKHVSNYMKVLQTENPDKFESQFSRYIKAGVTSENLEDKIKQAHAAIRADATRAPKKTPAQHYTHVREGNFIKTVNSRGEEVKYFQPLKLTCAQRKERVQHKLAEIAKIAATALQ